MSAVIPNLCKDTGGGGGQVTFKFIILITHTDTKVKYFTRKIKDGVILGYINIQTHIWNLDHHHSHPTNEGGEGGEQKM